MRTTRIGLGLWTCAVTVAFVAPLRADDPKPLPNELAWIPSDSAGVIHVRFAELWNSSVGKNAAKLLNTVDPKILSRIEQQFGLSLGRIETVTVVLSEVTDRDPIHGCAFRIRTTKPYDRRDIVQAAGVTIDKTMADRDLVPFAGRGMLHFSDDRTITFVPSAEGIYSLLGGLLTKSKSGALRPALNLAGEKNHVVVSFDVTRFPRIPVDQIPAEIKSVRALFDAKTVTLIGNLMEDNANVELRLTFGGKDEAAEGKQALDDGIKLAQKFLDDAQKDLERSKEQHQIELELLSSVRAALATTKVEQSNATVRATGQLKVAQFVSRLLVDGATALRDNADRNKSQNNLKQIGLAMHNFHDTYGSLPAAAICDKNGKPLLSWRVAILPYIEEDNLYKQFRLDEPWDSDHNIKLIQKMPQIYALPGSKAKHARPSTYYQVFVGDNAMFGLRKGNRFASITDGLSNTFMVVEAEDAVPWSKPDDITYDPKKAPPIGFHFNGRGNSLFGDGSVPALKKGIKEEILHLLIQRDDGMAIPNLDD